MYILVEFISSNVFEKKIASKWFYEHDKTTWGWNFRCGIYRHEDEALWMASHNSMSKALAIHVLPAVVCVVVIYNIVVLLVDGWMTTYASTMSTYANGLKSYMSIVPWHCSTVVSCGPRSHARVANETFEF